MKQDSGCSNGALTILEVYPSIVSKGDTIRLPESSSRHLYTYARIRAIKHPLVNIRYRWSSADSTVEQRVTVVMKRRKSRIFTVH